MSTVSETRPTSTSMQNFGSVRVARSAREKYRRCHGPLNSHARARIHEREIKNNLYTEPAWSAFNLTAERLDD